MSLLSKSFPVSVYSVQENQDQEITWDIIREKIDSFQFQDIDETHNIESAGFVSILDPTDIRFEQDYAFGDYIAATLRIDKRKIPPATLKLQLAKAVKAWKEERQTNKIPRAKKIELEAIFTKNLLARYLPVPEFIDFVWNLHSHELFVLSHTENHLVEMEAVFRNIFGMPIVPQIPFLCMKENVVLNDVIRENMMAISDNIEGADTLTILDETLEYNHDFILWLFFKSQEMEGLDFLNPCQVCDAEGKATFDNTVPELFMSLNLGRQFQKSTFSLRETELKYTTKTGSFGIKLPSKVTIKDSEETEGAVLDQIGFIEAAWKNLKFFYGQFAEERFGSTWSVRKQVIQDWIKNKTLVDVIEND